MRYRRIEIEQVAQRSTDLAAMYRFLERTGYQVDIGALRDRFPKCCGRASPTGRSVRHTLADEPTRCRSHKP
jgi:hypothetical protein